MSFPIPPTDNLYKSVALTAVALSATLPSVLLGQDDRASSHSCRPLFGLQSAPLGRGLPPGWGRRGVSGARMPAFEIVPGDDGNHLLRLSSQDQAAFAYVDVDPPLQSAAGETGSVSWRWRTATPLSEADLREKDVDDSPVRLFLIFAEEPVEGRDLLRKGRVLFYSWGNLETVGTSFPSHVSDRLAVWVLRNSWDADGTWRDESRDPFDDFREFFAEDPPPIRAVGLIPDTDQTGAAAVAEVTEVCWSPSAPSARHPRARGG